MPVTIGLRHASVAVDHEEVGDDVVALGWRKGAGFRVTRSPATIALDMAAVPPDGALVHPILTTPISVLARWRGDVTLHAGAFSAGGAAWAVIGEREAGKSTMLASLAARDVPIVADDLLTVNDGVVTAGPRCVDLRPDAAARFPAARSLGEVGGRPRFRMRTPEPPSTLPLGGFFVLDWSDDVGVEVEPLARKSLLELLYRQEYIALVGPADPERILDLLRLPAWTVRRPRDWASTDAACAAILAAAQVRG